MAKKRANGEGNIRKRSDGRWEGRYTAGYHPETGKRIIKNVLGKTQAECKAKLSAAMEANPTLSVMVNGNAVNGYQMVNRADVGGKYQGTWQTATASWVTIIRRLWNTPTLPKTGY